MIWWLILMMGTADAGPGRRRHAEPPPEPPQRPEVAHMVDHSAGAAPGSLWSESVGREMYGVDSNTRRLGDLVTVLIREESATTLDAATTASRDSSADYGVSGALGADQGLLNNNPGMGGRINVGGSSSSSFTGTGATSRGASVASEITCEIIEVLPAGTLRLWGYKELRVNGEVQYQTFEGVARPRDIRLDNTIESDRLAFARIETTGGGVLADKQRPGLIIRILDALWPF